MILESASRYADDLSQMVQGEYELDQMDLFEE